MGSEMCIRDSIEVDVSGLELGGSVHLGEIKLPEGVELASTIQESDLELSVASVLAPKKATVVEDDAAEEGAEGDAAAEGDSAE